MEFRTEVIIREKQPGEYYDEGIFSTLSDAVEHIQRVVRGNPTVSRAWINNIEVRLKNGYVYGDDGATLCTNPEWYRVFASGKSLELWNSGKENI